MNELSTSARDLLTEARGVMSPDDAARARVRSAVLVRVGVAAAAGTTLTATTSGASAASATVGAKLGVSLAAKVLVSVAIVGGIGTAGYVVSSRSARPAAVVEPTPAVNPAGPSPRTVGGHAIALPPPSEPPVLASPPSVEASPDPAVEPNAPVRSSLSQELSLLQAAARALERDDAKAALELAEEYDRSYPDGMMRPELAAIRIDALCALNRTNLAQQAARQFSAQWPDSPLVERVETSCAKGGAK